MFKMPTIVGILTFINMIITTPPTDRLKAIHFFYLRNRLAASVNAMKQICVIVILAYLPYSNPIRKENAAKH